jgi:hypothetical protein
LELLKSFQSGPWLVGEERQEHCWPNSDEGTDGGWRRTGPRASGAQGASRGGLGSKSGWPEVGFPRRPRRWRGASQRGRQTSSGLLAAAGGEGATRVAGLDREGAEGGVRRRQELTGEEGNDGDRAPVKDWRRGGVVELRRGAVKLHSGCPG